MADIFEHVDFQVIFVVIAVIVAALQAFSEKRKKRKAEEELFDDVNRRAEERREAGKPDTGQPESFEDLYEEYRREIAGDQSRSPTQPETHSSPWEEQAPSVPPPLPTERPATPPPAPVTRATPAPSWEIPQVTKASERLTAAELKALKSLEQRKDSKRGYRRTRSSSARRLLRDSGGRRRAIVLREIIGPPKGA